MKNIKYIFFTLLGVFALATSCQDDDQSLGGKIDPARVQYEIRQERSIDASGNTVILSNLTPGTVAVWDYQTGKSIRTIDTVHYPFKGEYTIKLSVMSGGSLVEVTTTKVTVTDDNLSYVDDPLWTLLSGGAGKEKDWVLDAEAKYFDGPLTFYDPANPSTVWWAPSPKDAFPNVMAAGDYGVMTFDLKGGAHFRANKLIDGVQEIGTYVLNTADMTLTINDATILRSYKPAKNGITGISDWQHYKVMLLNDDAMQLAVLRDRDVDGEGPALIAYNFISKEYSDSQEPEPEPEPTIDEGFNPVLEPGELLSILAGGDSWSSQVWQLDATGNPIDWIGKGKGWTTGHASTRDWGWNNTWDDAVKDAWIRFDRATMSYTRFQGGVVTNGSFTVNESTNEVILTDGVLLQNPDSGLSPAATTLKVIKAFPGKTDTKGIWFGVSYDTGKDEWFAFHYVYKP